MADTQLTDIAKDIGRLVGVTDEGFKGVHQRQDLTNGRVLRLEGRMEDLEVKAAALEAANTADADVREQLEPLLNFYKLMGSGKALIISAAAILSSFAVIAAAGVYLLQFIRGI